MTAKKTPETAPTVEQPENNDCFIIMPIADHPDYKQGHFKRVYEDILAPACRAAGYKPVRADDTKQANLIQLDILQKLLESPMAICDLSTRNPNVLFELGLRQAFDKPTILVQEEGTPRIFDINIFRYVEYRNGLDYRDVLADQRTIQEVLEETKKAVKDGKSVNSIIKLLSITNPASLQDTSNFGDKEYFQVLMSELQGIKHSIAKDRTVNMNSKYSYTQPNDIKNNKKYNIKITIYFADGTIFSDVLAILDFTKEIINVRNAETSSDEENGICIYFYCDFDDIDMIINKIQDFATTNDIQILRFRKTRSLFGKFSP